MFVTVINDCRSENDFGRQATRLATLFPQIHISTVGVSFNATHEAAGNLIDMLDAGGGEEGAILVNVAPRSGTGKQWPNGTPFGYFFYKETLVISTIDGYCLSLVKKLGLADEIFVTDIPAVIDHLVTVGSLWISKSWAQERISRSQFRSFNYVPYLAAWLMKGLTVPEIAKPISSFDDIPHMVWLVDEFGNCKTTILPEEVGFAEGKQLFGVTCYTQLKDVPQDQVGIIIGSSGIGDKRFLEIVVQGGSASKELLLDSGSVIN